jgi:hypothetical protein
MTKQNRQPTKRKRANPPKRPARRGSKEASATKTQACLDLLSRPAGATIEEMQKATGWQPHSVRGLLAGTIKKMPGMNLTSEKPGDGRLRRYYIRAA